MSPGQRARNVEVDVAIKRRRLIKGPGRRARRCGELAPSHIALDHAAAFSEPRSHPWHEATHTRCSAAALLRDARSVTFTTVAPLRCDGDWAATLDPGATRAILGAGGS